MAIQQKLAEHCENKLEKKKTMHKYYHTKYKEEIKAYPFHNFFIDSPYQYMKVSTVTFTASYR